MVTFIDVDQELGEIRKIYSYAGSYGTFLKVLTVRTNFIFIPSPFVHMHTLKSVTKVVRSTNLYTYMVQY